MGLQQSKDQLLYEQVNLGNIEGIRALHQQGAGLEWVDKDGKTPLIAACLIHDFLPVAKVLIELGANVNAYRPGCRAGTPLHHAAKKGLEQTVHLLLSSGANPFIRNDDCHTALDLAREKGRLNVVRAMESRLALFSGWLREHYGPSFLEVFAPQLLSRKVWAVVLPCDARNPARPSKFELAIYSDLQVTKPHTVISLWKAKIEQPKFNQADPALFIVDAATRTRYKFLSANEGDKQQLQQFYNACLGFSPPNSIIPSTTAGAAFPVPSQVTNGSTVSTGVPAAIPEDMQLEMAINASIQTALVEGVPGVLPTAQLDITSSSSYDSTHNGWAASNSGSSTKLGHEPVNPQGNVQTSDTTVALPYQLATPTPLPPSAPPLVDDTFYDGPIHYPAIDSSPIDISMPVVMNVPEKTEVNEGSSSGASKLVPGGDKDGSSNNTSGCCAICLDAPVEGACIPCGHMAGCMSCLKEIEAKSRECPVCRAKIDQVIRLYSV